MFNQVQGSYREFCNILQARKIALYFCGTGTHGLKPLLANQPIARLPGLPLQATSLPLPA